MITASCEDMLKGRIGWRTGRVFRRSTRSGGMTLNSALCAELFTPGSSMEA